MDNRTTYNPIVTDEMLSNYFIGQSSFEEAILIDEWMRKDAVNKFLYEQYVKILLLKGKDTDSFTVPEIQTGWQSVLGQISSSNQDKPSRFLGGKSLSTRKKMGYAAFTGIILIVLLWKNSLLQHFTRNDSRNLVLTSNTSNERFVLPDGSIVILNGESRLELQNLFYKNAKKEISLEGEGYFSTIADKQSAFVVKLKDASVTAMGSVFNIRSSGSSDTITVTAQSGSLVFSNSDTSIIVESGETGIYAKSKRNFHKAQSVDNNAIAYATRRLVFTNTPLKEVFNSLTNTYGVGFTILDPAIESVKFSAVFEAAPLDFILMAISKGAMIKFSSVDKSILVDTIPSTTKI